MRVLVADDHSLFRDGLVGLLEAAGYAVIAEVGDGDAAVVQTRKLKPELVLLDLTMPKLNGLEALAQILSFSPKTKVVILTVSNDSKDIHQAVKAGAHGYLLKSLNADEFPEMLDGLTKGEAAITRETTAQLMAQVANNQANAHEQIQALTYREIQLLELVGQGFSNRAIAERLSISLNTVKYHMKNVLQKLNAQNRAEAYANALRAGLIETKERDIQSPVL